MATKINLTLALPADEYNLLKSVSDDTGISRSDLISSLISRYLFVLKHALAAGATQTPEALSDTFQPEPGIPATQTDPDLTGDDPGDDVKYVPIED